MGSGLKDNSPTYKEVQSIEASGKPTRNSNRLPSYASTRDTQSGMESSLYLTNNNHSQPQTLLKKHLIHHNLIIEQH